MNDFQVGDFVVCIRTKKKHLVVSDRINAHGLVISSKGEVLDSGTAYTLDNGTSYWEYELTTVEDFEKGGYKPGQYWRNGTAPEHEVKWASMSRDETFGDLLATTRDSISLTVGQKLALENCVDLLRRTEKAVPVAADPVGA